MTIGYIPVTADGHCIFGLRSGDVLVGTGFIGLIGGTANKDEQTIAALDDVRQFMHQEIQEETKLDYDAKQLALYCLNFYRGKYEFLYTIRLSIMADQIQQFHKPGEFAQLIALTPEEALTSSVRGVDSFRFSRSYLSDLVNSNYNHL